jgi:capsular polysaccharide transport system ATP-binding protein
MIRLRGVTHRFHNGHEILTDVNVEIPSNRRVALLAPGGADKTSVLQLLSRQITPWRGQIERSGRVSFVGGFHTAFRPTLSARQNIFFAASLYGQDASKVFGFIREVSGLEGKLEIPFRQVGLQTRLSLTYLLAYALNFDTYLLDNMVGPIISEIPNFRQICEDLYAKRTSQGGAILTTREPRVAARYCNSAVVLRHCGLEYFEDLQTGIAVFEQDLLAQADSAQSPMAWEM